MTTRIESLGVSAFLGRSETDLSHRRIGSGKVDSGQHAVQ